MRYQISHFCFFILCFLVIATLPLQAQEFEKDLLKMKESLHALQSCRVELTSSLFNKEDPQNAFDKNRTLIWQKGWHSFTQSQQMEVLLNDQYLLTYVPEQALVSVNRHQLTESPTSKISLENIEEMFSSAESITYKGVVNNTKCYIVKPGNGLVHLVEYYLNIESGLPAKEVRHYKEGLELGIRRSVMEYRFINIHPSVSQQKLLESRYVEINEQNEVKLKPKYRKCQLILGEGLNDMKTNKG